jgi:negative regulator of flagellin synthesis FlgM
MKIDDRIVNYEISNHLNKTSTEQAEKVGGNPPPEEKKGVEQKPVDQDTVVHLSNASKEVQMIKEAIAAEPDIRADKVSELKEKIESGQYRIDHKAVAGKFVDTLMDEIS